MKMECTEALERISLRPWLVDKGVPVDEGLAVDGALRSHLASCSRCAGEAAFMVRVARARPEPPAGLVPAILGAVGRVSPMAGWWSGTMAAAAVLVLALGVGLVSQQVDSAEAWGAVEDFVMDAPVEDWGEDEWYVAGAPVLEALPDQMLLALLQEETW
jgi:hypothetical protein